MVLPTFCPQPPCAVSVAGGRVYRVQHSLGPYSSQLFPISSLSQYAQCKLFLIQQGVVTWRPKKRSGLPAHFEPQASTALWRCSRVASEAPPPAPLGTSRLTKLTKARSHSGTGFLCQRDNSRRRKQRPLRRFKNCSQSFL